MSEGKAFRAICALVMLGLAALAWVGEITPLAALGYAWVLGVLAAISMIGR